MLYVNYISIKIMKNDSLWLDITFMIQKSQDEKLKKF